MAEPKRHMDVPKERVLKRGSSPDYAPNLLELYQLLRNCLPTTPIGGALSRGHLFTIKNMIPNA